MLTDREVRFVREHLHEDVHGLLLSAHKYPDVDVPKCVVQIEGRRKIKHKIPEWYACKDIYIPSLQAAEQASSAEAARYKERFLKDRGTVVDMTGGLGVDAYYFAAAGQKVIYAEEDERLCQAARHNFQVLRKSDRIEVVHRSAEALWEEGRIVPYADLAYADPSRRGKEGARIRGLVSYRPDVTQLAETVLKHAAAFLVKMSPLEDISRTLELLPGTTQVHVVSFRNECKELLFLLEKQEEAAGAPLVVCSVGFSFYREEEMAAAQALQSGETYGMPKEGDFLYEPDASLLKAGAFALPAVRFGLEKLHRHSHLYVSSEFVAGFPGTTYRIHRLMPFALSHVKQLAATFPSAQMKVRNFPLSVDVWRKKTGIKDGGTDVLFGTTGRKAGKDAKWIIHATLWEENI